MNTDYAALHLALPRLTGRDRQFAESLLWQADEKRGALSEKQWYWVRKLAAQAAKPVEAAVPAALDCRAISAMFATAAQHKQFPKVRLQLEDGRKVVLSVASERSRRPGTINVTDGRPYGSNTWYGRVDPTTGAWEANRQAADAETMTSVTALLSAFAADPLAVAAAYGSATHHCCFCGLMLTDPRSKAAGYGPICAGNHGLSWGE